MNLTQTKSFQLATYVSGDLNAQELAIIIPGRLDTKDYAHMRSHVDFLASQGFLAVSFDPPGTWESPGDISLYTTTNILKATNELIEYYGNKPTLLVGHSRGGTNAILAGIANPLVSRFVAIMSHSGPTTVGLPTSSIDVSISKRDLPPGTERTIEKKEFALPRSYFEDQSQYNALEDLQSCPKPKLFFYGTDDELVTPDSVNETYEASAEPKMIQELKSEHDYRLNPEIIEQVNQTIASFLDKH